ncbi:hypothetical protein [Serratia microhaemolytica]|uniref:hypothetical protein n=1 Tax=Serratia microhaemolytica TaxID=2675110 RepID=UPI000FDEF48B|nr:hypothetical protein [Serratia microhaemolytica]
MKKNKKLILAGSLAVLLCSAGQPVAAPSLQFDISTNILRASCIGGFVFSNVTLADRNIGSSHPNQWDPVGPLGKLYVLLEQCSVPPAKLKFTRAVGTSSDPTEKSIIYNDGNTTNFGLVLYNTDKPTTGSKVNVVDFGLADSSVTVDPSLFTQGSATLIYAVGVVCRKAGCAGVSGGELSAQITLEIIYK